MGAGGSLAAETLGRMAVERWIETGDITDWVEACVRVRRSLGDPYGRSADYTVFVAGSVLELSPAQQARLRRDVRPALAHRLVSERGAERIPEPAKLVDDGRRVAGGCLAALTCGSAADEFAPLPTLVGLAAELMAAPSPLLEECFVEWDWSDPEVQAWGRCGRELMAEVSALAATMSAAIEGWYATADHGSREEPIRKIAATELLADLRRQVSSLSERLDEVEKRE